MTRMIQLSLLALLAATPVLAQTQPPRQPYDAAEGKMPVVERDARVTPALPPAATDAMQSSASQRATGKADLVDQPHRKYTRMEDYWQDR